MTPPAYADCSCSDEVKIDGSDDCQEDFPMRVEFTERERLDIENRLLREMAARYARLMEKEKRTGKPRGLDNRPVRRIRRAGNAPAANESERVRPDGRG